MTDQSTYMWSIRTYTEDILTNPTATPIKSATTSTTSMVNTLSVSDILTTDAKYLCVGIYTSSQISDIQNNGILGFTDYDIIPISFKYEGTIANLPDWLKEWNGDNAATINGQNLAAVSAYFGDKPETEDSDWTGVLVGNKVASIEGLPWQDDGYAYDFSGILGVKNFDTNPGDNYLSSVTFALDASTGNAYFNGEVHATSGTFKEGVFKTCTATDLSVTNSTIENCAVNTLTAKFLNDENSVYRTQLTIVGEDYEFTEDSTGKATNKAILKVVGLDSDEGKTYVAIGTNDTYKFGVVNVHNYGWSNSSGTDAGTHTEILGGRIQTRNTESVSSAT